MASTLPASSRVPCILWLGVARALALGLVSLVLCIGPPLPAAASGVTGGYSGPGTDDLPTGPLDTGPRPQERAEKYYARGLRHRERALEYEAKAREKDEGFLFFAPPSQKADHQWKEAVEDFQKAVTIQRDYPEAYNELGHAYRKLGRYAEALDAYDTALALEPGFGQAVEYRGEAYLKLGRLRDVKTSYMQLFLMDRELAGQLMAAMQEWLGEQKDAPAEGVSPEDLRSFRGWVEERAELAGQAGGGVSDARGW